MHLEVILRRVHRPQNGKAWSQPILPFRQGSQAFGFPLRRIPDSRSMAALILNQKFRDYDMLRSSFSSDMTVSSDVSKERNSERLWVYGKWQSRENRHKC
jgi:hypothetical protein